MATRKDIFINKAIQRCTMSAANTLTFQQINFAVGVFQGVAILINRINYHVGVGALRELVAANDSLQVGITVSQQIADISMTQIEVVDTVQLFGYTTGVADAAGFFWDRYTTDLSSLPGGGILVPANPIYIAMDSANLVAAGVVDCELLFTFRELSDADYIELIQSRVQSNL